MKEKMTAPFGDNCEIVLPEGEIDCSRLGYFDNLEYDCWDLIKKYAEYFGIEIKYANDDESDISFNVAKEIQDLIIEWFKGASVKFKFEP